MVFLCLKTREAIVTKATEHPNSKWVCQQTKWFAEQTKDREKKPSIILHDRDVKFTKEFTATVKIAGMKANPLPIASPNLNGRCERFIETIKLECLSKFIIFGKRHLDHLIDESRTTTTIIDRTPGERISRRYVNFQRNWFVPNPTQLL